MTKKETNNALDKEYVNMTPVQRGIVISGFYNIFFINEIIDYAIVDFGSKLKKSNIFRHEVKRWYNMFRVEKNHYINRLALTLGNDIDEFSEQADFFFGKIERDYQILYYSIRKEFLNAFDEDKVDYLTYMCIIGHTFTFARENYYDWRCFFKDKVPFVFNFGGFYDMDVTPWVNRWNMLVMAICKAIKYTPVEIDDTQMKLAFDIFKKKIGSVQLTFDSIHHTDETPKDVQIEIPDRPPHIPIPERYTNWTISDVYAKEQQAS